MMQEIIFFIKQTIRLHRSYGTDAQFEFSCFCCFKLLFLLKMEKNGHNSPKFQNFYIMIASAS